MVTLSSTSKTQNCILLRIQRLIWRINALGTFTLTEHSIFILLSKEVHKRKGSRHKSIMNDTIKWLFNIWNGSVLNYNLALT